MASEELTLRFAGALVDVVRPLETALQDDEALAALLLQEGWRAPQDPYPMDVLRTLMKLPDELPKVVTLIDTLQRRVRVNPGDLQGLLDAGKALVDELRSFVALPNGAHVLPAPFDDAGFWTSFPPQLALRLLAQYVEFLHPAAYAPLLLTGVIDEQFVPAAGASGRVDHTRVDWHWDRLPKLFGDPVALAGEVYGWGAVLDDAKLLDRLERGMLAFGFDAGRLIPHHALLDHYWPAGAPAGLRELRVALARWRDLEGHAEVGLAVLPIPPRAGGDDPSGLLVAPYGNVQLAGDLPLGASFVLQLRGSTDLEDPFGLEIRPDGVGGHVGAPAAVFDLGVALAGAPRQPWRLFGAEDTHRLEVSDLLLALELTGSLQDPELKLAARMSKAELVVDFGDADGFLAKIVGTEPQRLSAGVALMWSSKTGLSFEGTGSLRIVLPLNAQLGVVALKSVTVEVAVASAGTVLTLGATGGLSLGPVAATVEELGVRLALSARRQGDPPALFGDMNLELGFKPPTGAGLSIDAGVVSGGGFLRFDEDRLQYAGVVELELAGLALSAVGLITTRPGEFSLLVIISVEFSPVQLGFGFTLNGVGGLLAVNRTVALEEIRAGLAEGALDVILFPRDPVRNAPQLVAALGRYFPAAQGQYVVGPSVILGWGTPPILTITLGVMIEFPSPVRVVLAGQLRMVLPGDEEPVAVINVDLLGSLELAEGRLAIDASLRDSRVAQFALAGDVAIRASWGAEPGFLLAAGGFHPRFMPPAGLRPLDRLSISLATGDNPRLRLESYLALTSNTVQFGARLDLFAAAEIVLGKFSVSATVGFDALFEFDPFAFVVDIYASIVLKWDGSPFLGVDLAFTLSGPEPWRAHGEATFRFLGTHTVRFELTVGEEPPPAPPQLHDVLKLLRLALEDQRSWEAQRPPDGRTLVTVRAGLPTDEVVVHPLGSVTVRQRVVPLEREITRFGTGRPQDATYFEVSARVSDGPIRKPDALLDDWFARAQFYDLTDAERVDAPSFEMMPAAAQFGTVGLRLPEAGIRDSGALVYDEHLVDVVDRGPEPPPAATGTHVLAEDELLRSARAGAAAREGAAAARAGGVAGGPLGIAVRPLAFVVAAVDGMTVASGMPEVDLTYSEAVELLRRRLTEEPELAGVLAVVGAHEAVGAVEVSA